VPIRPPATGRQRGSRLLHQLGDFTAHAAAGLLAARRPAGVGGRRGGAGLPELVGQRAVHRQLVGDTGDGLRDPAHQTRQQSATQRKLDELLRALPAADRRLIAVEEAPDAELEALAELNLADRDQA